jgi:hydrogenase maturation protease
MGGGADRILVFGYGNPARGDDGLGPLLVAALRSLYLPDTDFEVKYQLAFDDAADLAGHAVVIFAAADATAPPPFHFSRVQPQHCSRTSGHDASPGEVLSLARDLFGRLPVAYLLGVRGHDLGELRELLSPRARANLGEALAFLSWALQERRFDDYALVHGLQQGGEVSAPLALGA